MWGTEMSGAETSAAGMARLAASLLSLPPVLVAGSIDDV
jgi:hypothetical protein